MYLKKNKVALPQVFLPHRAYHAEYVSRTMLQVHIENLAVQLFGKAGAICSIF